MIDIVFYVICALTLVCLWYARRSMLYAFRVFIDELRTRKGKP